MTERAPQDQEKYVVRFPDGMRDRLKAAAELSNRTLNAEIVARLQSTFPKSTDFEVTNQWVVSGASVAPLIASLAAVEGQMEAMTRALNQMTEENKFLREELSAMQKQLPKGG
jgi:hypothetical protein